MNAFDEYNSNAFDALPFVFHLGFEPNRICSEIRIEEIDVEGRGWEPRGRLLLCHRPYRGLVRAARGSFQLWYQGNMEAKVMPMFAGPVYAEKGRG